MTVYSEGLDGASCPCDREVDVTDDPANEERLRAEAVAWVQRLDDGRVAAVDIEALNAWRARSTAHEASFADAQRLWDNFAIASRQMRDMGELCSPSIKEPKSYPAFNRRAALRAGLAVAASSAFIYAEARPPLGLWPSFSELAADYRTTKGEQRRLALSGDAIVHLNTQTSLSMHPQEGRADRIELVSGEAAFSAVPGAGRPLVVVAADGSITATAGRFDVRRSGSSVCAPVSTVTFRLRQRRTLPHFAPPSRSIMTGAVSAADLELVTAWEQRVLIFRMVPLAEVVEEINRYRAGKVILVNSRLADLSVSGRYSIDHIDEILRRLKQSFDIPSRNLPGGIVLLG